MPTKDNLHRTDLIIDGFEVDAKTGQQSVILRLDPERYKYGESNGGKGYFDKFDGTFIPNDVFKKMFSGMQGLPIFDSLPKSQDMDLLFESRKQEIRSFLDGRLGEYQFQDLSEEFLSKLGESEGRKCVILSIDIKGSTKMSQELSEKDNAKIISLFSREMATLVANFNGLILKFLGDGLICYFPEPNFIGMTDNAIFCASAMREFILTCLNPLLTQYGLPELKFRIGLDSGETTKVVVGNQAIKQHTDLIGYTINLATKIQSLANENEILLGESTVLNAHTYWRKKIDEITPPAEWKNIDSKTGHIYKVYKLT